MPFVRFQDLRVYQLTEDLADAVWEIVGQWNVLARDTVGKQLIRSADSIGANIAEGSGRHSHHDNRRFIRIARGSLHETQHWLRRALRRKLLTTEIGPQLNAYLRSIGRPPKHQTPNTKH